LGGAQTNLFVEGALLQIYDWHPMSWCIPEDNELSKLEALICQPGNSDQQLPVTEDGVFFFPDITAHFDVAHRRYFFFAAAVAIEFCKYILSFSKISLTTTVQRSHVNRSHPRARFHRV
jgi:hypothetical protein